MSSPTLHAGEDKRNAMIAVEQALALQAELAAAVIRHDAFVDPVLRVTGVDVAYAADGERIVCAAVTLDADTLAPIEIATAWGTADFPYVPGLFSFRELPIVLKALEQLRQPPQLVVCDGQGIAHPRRFGLASHLGVVCDLPTIGCAKNRLIGTHDPLKDERGSIALLVDADETIGAVLRTQDGVRPIYASIGHRIALDSACGWILRLARDYRLPETTRAADHAVRMALKEIEGPPS
ncbi:deoxyribonuclease V [Sphingomonas sanxanigenens]|uniref:Endonuclease V n=1 Tax=Sphingomonas sanxanigenens DSM 19645 = NX02 TaxID=1123269 RepID=W0AF60_9SPHN|nr:deoxyribonuclease V [Sphingomonas sanxanigenens]AHE54310.1 hypothetical protein NX02_13060 [Sphingomonas sanxanigenens DSM 19645 = NX02]